MTLALESESWLEKLVVSEKLDEVEKAIEEAQEAQYSRISLDEEVSDKTDSIEDYVSGIPFLEQDDNPLDYVELFSYLWENKGEITNDYTTYEDSSKKEVSVEYETRETLTAAVVDNIIMEKRMNDMLGTQSSTTRPEDKDIFQIYKLFNGGLIRIKYSLCLG